MAFDGIRKTDEPKVPAGMKPIRLIVGYTKYGTPVAGICDPSWNQEGLREKCDRDHSYEEDGDDEPDNTDLIPVSHVQRIMLFIPEQPPTAKVAKAMDISGLMAVSESPAEVEVVAPDTQNPMTFKWE